LNDKFPEIENTLRRFTVALSAAVDPDAYREEYLKKLYKLLDPAGGESKGLSGKGTKDTIKYFADYVAGKTPKAALRSFVRQAQLERKVKRAPTNDDRLHWRLYDVTVGEWATDSKGQGVYFDGTRDEAMARVKEYIQNRRNSGDTHNYDLQRNKTQPAQQPQGVDTRVDYELYSRASGAVIDTFPARNDDEAMIRLNDYREHGAGQSNPDNFGVRRGPGVSAAASTTASHPEGRGRPHNPTGRYGIVARSDQAAYGRTGGPPPAYQFRFDMANLADQGHGRYVLQAWAARNSVDPADYIVVDTTQYADADQGGTVDVATDQPAPQSSANLTGEFSGQWKVVDGLGREVYRFGGVGNNQADANQIAQVWARTTGFDGNIEVYPVMAESLTETNRLTLRDFNVKLSPHYRDRAHAKGVDLRRVDDVLFNLSKVKDKIMSLEPGRAFILHDGQGTGLGMRRHLGNRLTLATVYPVSPGFNKGLYPTFRVDTVSGINEDSEQKPVTIYTNPANQGATVDDSIKKSLPVIQVPFDKLQQWESHKTMQDPQVADWVNTNLLPQLQQNGTLDPLSVWANDGELFVIDGNHRFVAYQEAGYKGRVPVQIVPDEMITIVDTVMAENFHDGRNPGRKGLSKRVGVNTKASVSSLRKTAKNSSGEKQRMSHWLANMKSGREKARRK